ncbi:hypothetical protein Trydic_g7959 [Trypoxylus dichotomus]
MCNKYSKIIQKGSVCKVTNAEKIYFFSLGGHLINLKDDEIGLDRLYANVLDFEEDELITFAEYNNVSKAISLNIFPCSKDDMEILELMAESIQDTLLNHINIVNDNQKAVIWVSNSIHVVVDIEGVQPTSPGRLEFLTEVSIRTPITKNNKLKSQDNNIWNIHLPIHLATENDENVSLQKNIVVRLLPLEESDYNLDVPHFNPLFVDDEILNYYKLNIGAKVLLDSETNIGDITKLQIVTDTHYLDEEIKKQFKLAVAEHSIENELLLNSNIPITTLTNDRIILKFVPDTFSTTIINSDFIRNGEISIEKVDILEETVNNLKKKDNEICLCIANLEDILNRCIYCLNLSLSIPEKLEHILILGKCGAGKTTVATHFAEKISSKPYYIHVEIIKCKSIKGKSVESLYKLFTNTFLKLVYYQPSVLIIDDIHAICERIVEEDPVMQALVLLTSEMLVDLFEYYLKNNLIMIVATAESTSKLSQHLFTSRGNHLFKNTFNIDELSKKDRETFLQFAFSKSDNVAKDVNFDLLSMKTEGFVVQDMIDFVDKCFFELYKGDFQEVNTELCLQAIYNFSSFSLKNVELYSSGDRDFSDVGGLNDVKRILIESIMWPVQYTKIFGNSPLRLQSGLLLYGPPGTGKTILAGAAAKQCGLRLISIKGPELLSKYIGASEQAVRDVFEKAQAAKPCVLFFDEFDSLAPRRGHDSTGVTDRVVNQFLTQLDGIENLSGVCVLAATSRPDLLDPALLRPGRLDQQILCPLPAKEERLAILKVLSKNLHLSEDVNLENIVAATEGYSGADLQSILYTAQLTSVEHVLSETETELISVQAVVIDQDHLVEALKNTRPSLTKEERLKYDRIYAKFQGKVDVDDIRRGKQKATLA